MNNHNFSSIRGLELSHCKIDRARWLNIELVTKNSSSFLLDCLNLLTSVRPNWHSNYINDREKIALRPRWNLNSDDRRYRYSQLQNGLYVRTGFSKTRTCAILTELLDYELAMPSLPRIVYQRKIAA